MEANTNCPSCGFRWTGNYCSSCGERRLSRAHFDIKQFLLEAFSEVTSFDNSLIRSLKLLFLKPGELTVAYFKGKRKRYISPLRLFFLCNLVYFFVQPYSELNGFNTPLYSQENNQVYRRFLPISDWVKKRIATQGLARATYEKAYNERSALYARTLIILNVPLLAVFFMLIWGRSRKYFLEHLILAFHHLSWMLFYFMSIFLFVYLKIYFYIEPDWNLLSTYRGVFIEVIPITFLGVYLFFEMRNFTKESNKSTLLKTLLMTMGTYIVIVTYRLILFAVTFLTV